MVEVKANVAFEETPKGHTATVSRDCQNGLFTLDGREGKASYKVGSSCGGERRIMNASPFTPEIHFASESNSEGATGFTVRQD